MQSGVYLCLNLLRPSPLPAGQNFEVQERRAAGSGYPLEQSPVEPSIFHPHRACYAA